LFKQLELLDAGDVPCLQRTEHTQGKKAQSSGRTAEATIYCVFKERGYKVSKQVKAGTSIYGQQLRADLFIDGIPGFDRGLIIESKWQSTGGSVDEKYVYLVKNIESGRYPCPVAIVLDGGGYKQGAEDWLKKQVDGNKLYAVWSLMELLKWINANQL